MKKIIFLSIVMVGLASCKKDRVCTCTYQDGTTYSEATYAHITKKEAKTLCTSSKQDITCTVK
jgi:hypothetical protein